MAVPAEAWRRKTAKRILPNGALKKAVRVEVPLCADGDRATAAESRLWLYGWGCCWPSWKSTCAWLRWPTTTSALSLQSLEEGSLASKTVGAMELQLQQLSQLLQGDKKPPSGVAAASKKKATAPPPFPELPPGLDPGGSAGAPSRDLQGGFGRDGRHLASISCSGFVREPRVTFEEEPEDVEVLGGSGEGDAVAAAVVQMSKIFSQMHQDKYRAKDKSLEGILDFAGLAQQLRPQPAQPGPRLLLSAEDAARKTPPPLEIERAMQQDWERSSQLPGVAAGGVTARGWLEHRSKVQNFPSTVRTAWMIAGVLDALRCDKIAEARARCCLALASLDHQAVDKGSWILAGEVSLEQPPPFHSFALHRAPEPWDVPHSSLVGRSSS